LPLDATDGLPLTACSSQGLSAPALHASATRLRHRKAPAQISNFAKNDNAQAGDDHFSEEGLPIVSGRRRPLFWSGVRSSPPASDRQAGFPKDIPTRRGPRSVSRQIFFRCPRTCPGTSGRIDPARVESAQHLNKLQGRINEGEQKRQRSWRVASI